MTLEAEKLALIQRLQDVQAKIIAACQRVGRSSESVTLVTVTKKRTVEQISIIKDYLISQKCSVVIGENYVQEFLSKKPLLGENIKAHLIGALQRNKAKLAVQNFDVIQSVHSWPLAQALNKAAEELKIVKEIFLQVNISQDPNKSGFAPEEVQVIVEQEMPKLKNLKLVGLMTITKDYPEAELVRPDFKALKQLKNILDSKVSQPLALSMGMSSDYEIAIEEGATVVRVGTAIFGERDKLG